MFISVTSSPVSESACSPRRTPKSPGSPYFAYNPDTLDQMKYRDLQSLARKLNLGGKGTREALIEKLSAWHTKSIIHQDRSGPIQNFSMVPAAVECASPRLLSPLMKKAARNVDGTPRGILSPLKRARAWVGTQPEDKGIVTIAEEENEEQVSKKPRKSISFSVFNGVRLISPRRRDASPPHYIQPESDPGSLNFGTSAMEENDLPRAVSPEALKSVVPPPAVEESARPSPLQAMRRVVSLPMRIPSLLSSFLSPAPPPALAVPSFPSSSIFTFNQHLPSPLVIPPEDALPYPSCQTSTTPEPRPDDSLAFPSSPSVFSQIINQSAVSVTQMSATTTIIESPAPFVPEQNSSDILLFTPGTTTSKPAQEKWSAKERRARRSSFGEGAREKENRLAGTASAKKSSRVSLPIVQRPRRRQSLV